MIHMSLCLLHCYGASPRMHLNSAANVSFPKDSLKEPHCGASFAEGCETSCLTLAMHRLSAESSQARHWLEIRTMVFWTFRPCIPGSHPHSHSVEHLLEHLHPLFSLFCLSCSHWVARELFVLPAVGTALLCSRVLGSLPWLFHFLHGRLARVSSTKSNDFNANFSFGITAAVHSKEPAQF